MGERYNAYKPVISRLTTWNNLNHSTNDSGISSNSSDFTYYSGSNTTKTPQMGKRHDIGRYVMKYQLNNPLTALSSSPDQTRVIVAGSSVLKILNVSDKEITEESNLNVRHGNRNSNITDVKWGNSFTKSKVATAATTGSISIWDVGNGQPKSEQKISAHERVVNRVCFNPMQGNYLLSASHDGAIRLWDLRDLNQTTANITFEGKCESVRDVQFNSGLTFGNEFAAAFENGTIQKWDLRKPNIYERRLNAHVGPVLAIDWNSDGKTIASGGRDKTIKIWDMGGAYSTKPKETIYSMSSVARVQWRPNNPSEVASCSLQGDNRIFVWNIKRPYIASFFFEEHVDVPTGFLWHESDILWSCSKDRFFIQQDIRDSHRQLDLLSKCAIGWNVYDQIAFAIEKSNDPHSEEQNKSIPSSSQSRFKPKPSVIEPRSEDHYQLQQKVGSISLPPFDPKSFSHLARNYISSGADIWTMCDHNAKVAWDVQRYRTAQTWKIVQLLYGKKASAEMDKTESNKDKGGSEESSLKDKDLSSATHSKSSSEAKDTDSLKDPDNDEDLYPTDPESESESESDEKPCPKHKRIQTPASITNTIVLPKFNRSSWDKEPMMTQLLDYYAEQGDVQMCVTLILVLGDKLKISEERAEQWFFSYIDLLHRFQLWCAATSVIKYCNNTAVGMLNQQSTTIYTTCNNCFKPIDDAKNESWLCARCKRLNLCSLCHVTVKGLYTWCQGCSHGGHHSHMQDWFSCNEECPTGCGHKCLTFLV
ncbi:WD40 repeat-like protein [Gigaspora margarita]|uniref:WD40 repeat-like protein n=1 Tax=Gigaspora margarita TaxID=4874 RepID=A0A8H3XBZ9_GIGMA|nr:WD40 repeat-like protein [Gigaspora margarita]